MINYFYVIGTLLLTVYGQVILKWRVNHMSDMPEGFYNKIFFLFKAILDPFILSGFLAAFIASLLWIAAMTKIEITRAYPFMSLSPALVFIFGIFFLGETFTKGKVIGLILIISGIIITVKF
jgi:drug/metabolite transporter (DMT)-like permease